MNVQQIAIVLCKTRWKFHKMEKLKMKICYGHIFFLLLFYVHGTFSFAIVANGDGFHG